MASPQHAGGEDRRAVRYLVSGPAGIRRRAEEEPVAYRDGTARLALNVGRSLRWVIEGSERRGGESYGAATRQDRQFRGGWKQPRRDRGYGESPVRAVGRPRDDDPHDSRRRWGNADLSPDQHRRHAGEGHEDDDHEDHHDRGQVARRAGRRSRWPHRRIGCWNRGRRDRGRQRDPAVRAEQVPQGIRRATTRTSDHRGRAVPPASRNTPNGGKYLRGNVDAVPPSARSQQRHI